MVFTTETITFLVGPEPVHIYDRPFGNRPLNREICTFSRKDNKTPYRANYYLHDAQVPCPLDSGKLISAYSRLFAAVSDVKVTGAVADKAINVTQTIYLLVLPDEVDARDIVQSDVLMVVRYAVAR